MSRQRDRAIAVILSFKDDHVDQHLPPQVARDFRQVILDAVNTIEEPIVNQFYLDKIIEIHEHVVPDGDH